MKTSEFDYKLPKSLIGQSPLSKRDESKLLVLDKDNGEIKHDKFYNIINYLEAGDVIVFNNSKVIKARLFGIKEETKAKIEILLLKNVKNNIYEMLVKPQKRVKKDTVISFGLSLKIKIIENKDEGLCLGELIYKGSLNEILDNLGKIPLPPYITKELENEENYQTVYAEVMGSSAAPTAGLHFNEKLIKRIEEKGIKIAFVTLHVGLGTFRPVTADDIKDHKMHSEFYTISRKTAEDINYTKNNGGKVVAVGTTTLRALESSLVKNQKFKEDSGYTDIFIYPGYDIKSIDCLITNFHLPKSTLLMLVSAFSSKEYIMKAYKEAIKKEYRFFSFGDAMFIKRG